MPLATTRKRLLSALPLTPGMMLLPDWMRRFAGAEAAAEMGTVSFSLWASGVAFGIAATTTPDVDCRTKPAGNE